MLPTWYNKYRNLIENSIDIYLQNYFGKNKKENPGLKKFKEAIFYATKGGKKLRAILALEIFLLLKKQKFSSLKKDLEEKQKLDDILKFCIAIELVHAYSLVHDDLPCMDNDILRRGKATVWKKFGEYQAVFVGDTLNSLAFEVISEIKDPILSVQLANLLSKSVGYYGMIGGQVDDMYFEENPEKMSVPDLTKLHNKKTGALIKASIQGGILCSKKLKKLHRLSAFGEKLGLAFQIKDDLLDVEGEIKQTGKSVGDGEEKGFVYFMGIDNTKKRLKKLISDCKNIIKELKSDKLDFLVGYVGSRSK